MKLGKYIRGLRNSYRENKKTFVFYTILRAERSSLRTVFDLVPDSCVCAG